jgi:hypothetical protein
VNVLNIDPKNLTYAFRKDWFEFSDSRVKKFLVAWLRRELKNSRLTLESVSPADLGKAQGIVSEIKKMLHLVEQPHCPDDALREVVTFLEES